MADGLDSLAMMRNKAAPSRRALPPPRHQPRRTPVQMPEPSLPPVDKGEEGQLVETGGQNEATPVTTAPTPTVSASNPGSELTKVSIYLDDLADSYLETVRAAARTAKPRVDATRSAVVRLALNRLSEQLQPAEVIAELQRNAAAHIGPGRKRA